MSGGGLRQAARALRVPAYRWWFASQVLAFSGSMTQQVAQSWLVLRLTGRAVDLGVLSACLWGPVLLGAAWAGAVVDRVDRRRLLLVTQVLLVTLGVGQGVLVATGTVRVWMVYALAAATGAVTAFDSPARQVYVLELVGPERLASAVSLYEVVVNASRVLGPATGGLLLATLGPAACFCLNGAFYLPALAVLARYRPAVLARYRPAVAAPPVARTRRRIREGLRYVWHAPPIRACVLIAAAGAMLFNLGVALPVLATRVFHLGGGGYGALMAAFGVGAIPGALCAAAGSPWPSGRRVRMLALLTGVAVVLTAAAPALGFAYAGMAAAGFLSIWLIALANTLVQVRSAAPVRGRVMGVWTMALPGTMPFSGLVTGVAAQAVGPRTGFAAAGVVMLVTVAATWRSLSGSAPDGGGETGVHDDVAPVLVVDGVEGAAAGDQP